MVHYPNYVERRLKQKKKEPQRMRKLRLLLCAFLWLQLSCGCTNTTIQDTTIQDTTKLQARGYFNTSILYDLTEEDIKTIEYIVEDCYESPMNESDELQLRVTSFHMVEVFTINEGETEIVFCLNHNSLQVYNNYGLPTDSVFYWITTEQAKTVHEIYNNSGAYNR